MGKVELCIAIDTELLAKARAAGVVLEDAAEVGLRLALVDAGQARSLGAVAGHLRQMADPDGASERARRWAEENAGAIRTHPP